MKTSAEILMREMTEHAMLYEGLVFKNDEAFKKVAQLIQAEKEVLKEAKNLSIYISGNDGEVFVSRTYGMVLRLEEKVKHLQKVRRD